MFMCEWCENYRDKSESRENPKDDCSSICDECADEYKYKNEELLNRCSIHGLTIDQFLNKELYELEAATFPCGKCDCTLYFDDENHEDGLCEECFIEDKECKLEMKKYNLG